MPAAAKFIWRAENEWKSGTHAESRIQGFFGLGEEQRHVREFCFDSDHPEVFVVGDMAAFVQDGATLPGVSPVALQQARVVELLQVLGNGGLGHIKLANDLVHAARDRLLEIERPHILRAAIELLLVSADRLQDLQPVLVAQGLEDPD